MTAKQQKQQKQQMMSNAKTVLIVGLALATALIGIPYPVPTLITIDMVYGVIGLEHPDRSFFFIVAIALATAFLKRASYSLKPPATSAPLLTQL